jgi:hypothetical protein
MEGGIISNLWVILKDFGEFPGQNKKMCIFSAIGILMEGGIINPRHSIV